ncbi:MAG: O-methyltransferase [Pseudobdellovibrionaceae bacterium]
MRQNDLNSPLSFELEMHSYLQNLSSAETELQLLSRQKAKGLGLEGICLSSWEAQILAFFIRSQPGLLRFVEVGCLTGLSAQYIFSALPAGDELWTLEKSPVHAAVARNIFAQLENKDKQIHLLEGDARDTLQKLADQLSVQPGDSESVFFDGIFIDGNKAAYGDYLHWAEKHIRPGGWIFADNVFLSGAVWGASTAAAQKFSAKQIQVMRDFNLRLSDRSLYNSCVLPTSEGLLAAQKLF